MANEEEQQKRSRVVVQTPNSRREVEHVYAERTPERKGYSSAAVAGVALVAIAVTALIVFFLLNKNNDQDNTNINARIATATTPTPLPSMTPIIETPPPMQPAPIIVTPPATTAPAVAPTVAPTAAPTPRQPDDATIQANVSKKLLDDTDLANADVTATVGGGKVILTGTVATPALKSRAEKLARTVKGVTSVDNKITVSSTGGLNAPSNPSPTP